MTLNTSETTPEQLAGRVVKPAAFALVLLLALTPLLRSQAVEGEDLTTQIESALDQMRSGELSEVYTAAFTLVDIGDAVVPILRTHILDEEDEWVTLGCIRALVDLDAANTATDRLLELTGVDKDSNIRIAALDLVSLLPRDRKAASTLSDRLDRTYDPQIKSALAKALYNVGDAGHRIRAREELKGLIESEDKKHRIAGGLALAEIGAFELARPVLLEIEDDPSLEGRLARSYMKVEKINRYWENRETRRLGEQDSGATIDDKFEVLAEILALVQREHIYGDQYRGDEGEDTLISAAAKGMLAKLDRHSTYFSPEEYEKWLVDLQRNYAGIGAYVQTIGGFFTITRPIYSGPAFKAGLRSDDKILKVDGWDTYEKPQQDVIDRLKSTPGTDVEIEVMRIGWKEPRKYVITRAVIEIPSVRYELFPGNVGYLGVETFGDRTGTELRTALEDLKAQGAEGFILDLRDNPGGYLRQAIGMVEEFMGPKKLVVYTEGRKGDEDKREYFTSGGKAGTDGPVVILINQRSASASEIVSGALSHYDRAILVGKKTFGKGSVQNPFQLQSKSGERWNDRNRNQIRDPNEEFEDMDDDKKFDYGAMFKLTTQLYYLPDGSSIHTQIDGEGRVIGEGGVSPDVEVDLKRTPAWMEDELSDLIEEEVFKTYIDEHLEGNEDLFVELAVNDGFDTSRYPEFEEFYEGLDTHLDRNEIRKWTRLFLRVEVADLRKKPFPGNNIVGDYQEDSQLQMALVELLRKMGRDPHSVAEYKDFADVKPEEPAEAEKEQVKNDG